MSAAAVLAVAVLLAAAHASLTKADLGKAAVVPVQAEVRRSEERLLGVG